MSDSSNLSFHFYLLSLESVYFSITTSKFKTTIIFHLNLWNSTKKSRNELQTDINFFFSIAYMTTFIIWLPLTSVPLLILSLPSNWSTLIALNFLMSLYNFLKWCSCNVIQSTWNTLSSHLHLANFYSSKRSQLILHFFWELSLNSITGLKCTISISHRIRDSPSSFIMIVNLNSCLTESVFFTLLA